MCGGPLAPPHPGGHPLRVGGAAARAAAVTRPRRDLLGDHRGRERPRLSPPRPRLGPRPPGPLPGRRRRGLREAGQRRSDRAAARVSRRRVQSTPRPACTIPLWPPWSRGADPAGADLPPSGPSWPAPGPGRPHRHPDPTLETAQGPTRPTAASPGRNSLEPTLSGRVGPSGSWPVSGASRGQAWSPSTLLSHAVPRTSCGPHDA